LEENQTLKNNLNTTTRACDTLRLEMDGIEKERDFYFDKLRDIEILFQEMEDSGQGTETTAAIFKILYATADGFEQTDTAIEGDKHIDEVNGDNEEVEETY
jgi:RP/EB family microtubule-associated protein